MEKEDAGGALLPQDVDAALAEIEGTLDQMLLLAQLSASGMEVDREALQATLERLQEKIDRIADRLDGGAQPGDT